MRNLTLRTLPFFAALIFTLTQTTYGTDDFLEGSAQEQRSLKSEEIDRHLKQVFLSYQKEEPAQIVSLYSQEPLSVFRFAIEEAKLHGRFVPLDDGSNYQPMRLSNTWRKRTAVSGTFLIE
jgi:hypothetical protein